MELLISARSKTQEDTVYRKLEYHNLEVAYEVICGDGSLKNPKQVCVTIYNKNNANWYGIIHLELPFVKVNPRFYMPAFMYGRNRGECPQNVPNEFPRLRDAMNRPSSPWWMVRGDRLSHPVTMVWEEGKIYGICASPYFITIDGKKQQWKPDKNGTFYQYAGYTCSLEKGTVGYTLGYENAPLLFVKSHDVRERAPLNENCFELNKNESIEVMLSVYEFDTDSLLDVNDVIQEVYYEYYQRPRSSSDLVNTVKDLSKAVYEDAWLTEDLNYAGQVFEEKDGSYRYNKIISIAWTNGLAVATPMLMAALRTGHEGMRKQALSCIENIINHSINPMTGLPYEAYHDGVWSNKGWWFDGMHTPGHSSYLIGQALFYIMKAYEYEKKLKNCIHEDWMAFVKPILMKLEKTKNTDHEYPFILSEKSGAGIEYDSMSGAWCLAAMAYYCYLTGEESFLEDLKKSERHYYSEFIKKMECYGGPLDTDKATDSEGVLAYIKAVRYLHACTGEDEYLEHMRGAIRYEFSFKFCYNSPVQLPPLSRIGWSSCGGSVTSIANPHIHPMSCNVIDELWYYVNHRDDRYIRGRMMDTILWACQTYNLYDREYDFGKKGWMSERFCYSEGLVSERYSDGSLASTWFCLMPWAIGSLLDGLSGDYWDDYNKNKM